MSDLESKAASSLGQGDHDARLQAAVHPPDWRNPLPRNPYNLVVIGGGTAGLVAAAGCAGLSGRVALIEKKALGGDCLNTGCIPSKALIRAGHAAHAIRGASAYGIRVETEPIVDFDAVMERVRKVRADLSIHDSAARFRDLGVDVFFGEGRFIDGRTIGVGDSKLRFTKALIASGARPYIPPIPGLNEAGFLTSDSVFDLRQVPARLAVIGAGAVGCELAQAFARLGAHVTLFERRERTLPLEEASAAGVVQAALIRDDVQVVCSANVDSVKTNPDGLRSVSWTAADEPLQHEGGRGLSGANPPNGNEDERHSLEFDQVLVAAGRTPNTNGLGLDAAGVRVKSGRIVLDSRLRTTNRRIFAAGDVASEQRFTHAADAMARIVLRNALFMGRQRFEPLTIPRSVFTDPELAHIGRGAGDDGVRTSFSIPFKSVDRVRTDDALSADADAGYATVYVGSRDTIVGATIVGSGAGEMIGAFAQAISAGTGLRDLSELILPYPTRGLAVRALGDAYQRSRLSSTALHASKTWLGWARKA